MEYKLEGELSITDLGRSPIIIYKWFYLFILLLVNIVVIMDFFYGLKEVPLLLSIAIIFLIILFDITVFTTFRFNLKRILKSQGISDKTVNVQVLVAEKQITMHDSETGNVLFDIKPSKNIRLSRSFGIFTVLNKKKNTPLLINKKWLSRDLKLDSFSDLFALMSKELNPPVIIKKSWFKNNDEWKGFISFMDSNWKVKN